METLKKSLRILTKILACLYFHTNNLGKKTKNYIPVSGKVLGSEELTNMIDASLDMWLTAGPFNDEFESKLAKFFGLKFAITTNSGSSANLLAITALTSPLLKERALQAGDEVITVAAGFPTTINPIIQNSLVPVFVDIELETNNINADQIEEAISPKTKAIFIAHTLGNVYDLQKIQSLAKKYNLWLIEDNCDAFGSKFLDQYTGTFGDIATLSFYPAHHITMGEGGALLTNNSLLKKIILSFRDWGRDCWCPPGKDNTCNNRFSFKMGNLPEGYDHKYIYSHIGYNLKITDWQAACALAQLDKVNDFILKRKKNYQVLYQELKKFEDHFIFAQAIEGADPSWFGFPITIKKNAKFTKIQFSKYLEDNGIGTRQLFAGNVLRQPAYLSKKYNLRIKNSQLLSSDELEENHYALLPNSDFVMNNCLWIGLWPGLDFKDLKRTITVIEAFVNNQISSHSK